MDGRWTIFLDDGGVMNDNRLRGPQWQRFLGEFLPPRLGGEAAAWAEANRVVAPPLWDGYLQRRFGRVDVSFAAYERAYAVDWLGGMCRYVGVEAPDEAACVALLREASAYVTPRVRAAFPGAVDAIRQLHAEGYPLYTASGEASYDLEGYLTGMGVRECFRPLYGSDLVDVLKESPLYYERLFADAGVEPARGVVVDDRPQALAWAKALGAKTVWVSAGGEAATQAHCRIGSLAALPEVLPLLREENRCQA